MLYGGAEHHGTLVPDILQPGIHNQPVAFRNIDFAFQIPNVVLNAVKAHFGQINVGVDADAAHRHQFPDFYSGLDIQLVCCVLENVQNHLVVIGAFRCGGQPQSKGGLEIRQHLLICISGGVVGLIHNEIIKSAISELI